MVVVQIILVLQLAYYSQSKIWSAFWLSQWRSVLWYGESVEGFLLGPCWSFIHFTPRIVLWQYQTVSSSQCQCAIPLSRIFLASLHPLTSWFTNEIVRGVINNEFNFRGMESIQIAGENIAPYWNNLVRFRK